MPARHSEQCFELFSLVDHCIDSEDDVWGDSQFEKNTPDLIKGILHLNIGSETKPETKRLRQLIPDVCARQNKGDDRAL